jgi:histidinol-phosphatase (PHP family)
MPGDYAAAAARRGLLHIGFSDHSPMREDDFDNWRMRLDQLDYYVEEVRRAQKDFPRLSILLALEMDYLPAMHDWISELSRRHPWDYLIGSVHYVSDSWDIDNPEKKERWRTAEPMQIWSAYFERLGQAAESGFFDIIGHADLPKKFGCFPPAGCAPLFDAFCKKAAAGDVAIELNTAGLRKDCREIYPSRQFLDIARSRRVPITFGSDAHAPDEVGMGFDAALKWARDSGYSHYVSFHSQGRTAIPLPELR